MQDKYKLIIVDNEKLAAEFLDFPSRLYKNDPYWVRPLDSEIEKIFDPQKNKNFRTGDAIRWLAVDNNGNTMGRIAAFYEKGTAMKNNQPTGGVGFFESVNNQEVANLLFDAGKEWLQNKGMEAMDGPVNFGERDVFWGCLYDGFTDPNYNMPYNFKYYNDLFNNYGFKEYFKQYTYRLELEGGLKSETVRQKALRLRRDPGYNFEILNWKVVDRYADDFMVVFNKAWAKFPGVKPVRKAHAMALLKSLKPIIDPRAVLFGYYHGEPIAFFIMVPNLNPIIKPFNGKMNLLNKIRLFVNLKILKKSHRLIGLIFGVVPEHQGKGVESGLILRFEDEVLKPDFPFTELEMNWIGDFNPSMMKLVEQIGSTISKTHITYRYLFDRNKPFERAKKLS